MAEASYGKFDIDMSGCKGITEQKLEQLAERFGLEERITARDKKTGGLSRRRESGQY